MSVNGRLSTPHVNGNSNGDGHSNALDVGFKSVADRNGESSSLAESRSSGRRSDRGGAGAKPRRDEAVQSTPTGRQKVIDGLRHSGSSARRRANKSGAFLLEPLFANGSPRAPVERNGKGKAPSDTAFSEKKRQVQDRVSHESSPAGSALSRQVSGTASTRQDSASKPTSRPQSMDASQLVQMALNLSESRKRNISGSLPVPLQSTRRDFSGELHGSRLSSSARDPSQRLSTASGDGPGSYAEQPQSQATQSVDAGNDNIVYTFTPSTLSRAERARKYFEQASEYRRLLQHLPPLQTSATATDPAVERLKSSRGTKSDLSQQTVNAGGNQQLGRKYNPIQSLRNRRVRLREKTSFPVPEEDWQNTDRVRRWVDNVSDASKDPQYRISDDKIDLPDFPGYDGTEEAQKHEVAKGRRRADTVNSVITRPENSWTIEPSELLADAYWTEKDDNKGRLENRRGNLLFPGRKTQEDDMPRASMDSRGGRDTGLEQTDEADDVDDGRPSRRRKLILPIKGHDSRRHKRLLSRASSPDSATSVDSPIGRTKTTKGASYENSSIGPLERYMQEQIAKEEREARGDIGSSPEAKTSDRWELMHRQNADQAHRGAFHKSHHPRASLEVPQDMHRRSRSAEGRVDSFENQGFSSADETDTDEVNMSAGTDLSSPAQHFAHDGRRSKRSKLGLFRPQAKDRHKIAQTDFAVNGTPLAPILSADSGRPRSSMESSRPSTFRRHKTGESISSTLGRTETNTTSSVAFASTRDTGSSVGRFFKGGRIGDLVRGESSRLGDRLKGRERPEDMDSDAEDYLSSAGIQRSNTDESIGSERPSLDRPNTASRYAGALPAFTSAARERRPGLSNLPTNENLSPLPEVTRDTETPTNDDLPPNAPRIVLTNSFNASNPELAQDPATSLEQGGRKNYGFLQANSNTASRALGGSGRDASPEKRHWSISDHQAAPAAANAAASQIVTKRDIARVRALLLSSGIKAREIQRRADTPRDPPNALLVLASKAANKPLPRDVPRKQDDTTAARLFSDVIDARISALETALTTFQSGSADALASRLDALHAHVAEDLSVRVRDTSDAADAFVVELTTRQPQNTKQVDDAVDAMLRLRRRQFRLLRRAGFKLLEWFTLGLMWGIWLTVVVLNLVRKSVVFVLVVLRWLFSF